MDEAQLSDEVIEGTFDLARNGRVGPVGEMIDAGVPINVRNARSDTMLIVATYAQQPAVVAELIRRGAALDVENASGQTAISCAVFRGDGDMLRLLLAAGADPDAGFRTGAHIAQQFGRTDMLAILSEVASRAPQDGRPER